MENAMILLYDICRLCLDEPGVYNIFKPVDLSQDILTYTGVKVTTTDKMPQRICTSCRDIISCVKVLKELATTNDARLQAVCGSNDDRDTQVLVTDSAAHFVIISACTSDSTQNVSSAPPEITSSSVNKSCKDRITFEGDKCKDKHSKKKKKSSSKHDDGATKFISVRKDLFESSSTVTSSTKSEPRPSTTSPSEDPEKKVKTSTTPKRELSPTISPGRCPEKKLKVDGKELKVHQFEYKCETCSKSYATHKKLYLHQLAHNKKFNCPLDACGKMFATKGDLQKHNRTHTGEKPFKCNLCEQSFTQNVSLKAHKQKIHDEFKSQS